jgi:hypothetical protein
MFGGGEGGIGLTECQAVVVRAAPTPKEGEEGRTIESTFHKSFNLTQLSPCFGEYSGVCFTSFLRTVSLTTWVAGSATEITEIWFCVI